jgi:hypothetical protein
MSEASLPAVRRVPDVAERAFAGEIILVPIRTDPRQKVSVLTLNEVGTFIWAALREEQTVRSLAVAISEAFEVSVEQATADVMPFLQQLRSRGLVLELP